jgi:hypothetical protein
LKIDFQGSRVTSDGGLILVRELDERLGLGGLIEQHLRDPRRGKNTQFPLADLLRQSVYSRLAGCEDVHDAERLSQHPTFRLIGSEQISRARRGADFPVAVLRDREAGRRRELRRLGADQPGTDRQGRRLAQRFCHFAQVAQVIDFTLTCSQPSLAEIGPIWLSLAQVAHNRHTKIGL